jgi:VPDSG-CTERM motif
MKNRSFNWNASMQKEKLNQRINKQMKTPKLILIAAVALVLPALPAFAVTAAQFAASIPAGASDIMTVYNAAGQTVGNATSFEPEAPDTIREVDTNLADPAQIGDYYIVYESDGTTVSDIVGVEHGLNANGTAHAVFAYVSDPFSLSNWIGAGKAFDGTQLGSFVEPANGSYGIFDISNLINPAGGAAGGNAFFASDAPDSGTAAALLGIALAGIEGLRRKIGARKA